MNLSVLPPAVAACMRMARDRRRVRLNCAVTAGSLVIILENSFDGKPPVELNGRFRSTKRYNRGIGLASVISIPEKHGGMAVFTAVGGVFRSESVTGNRCFALTIASVCG